MNKRQAKKAYKKKYGHNPPKSEAKYLYEVAAKAVEGIAAGIKQIMTAITAAVSAAMAAAKEAIENIKTMPEEDFNRLLESSDLDEGTKEMVRRIRRTGQNGLYNSNTSETRRDSEGSHTEAGTGDNNELHSSRADNAAGNEQRYKCNTGSKGATDSAE